MSQLPNSDADPMSDAQTQQVHVGAGDNVGRDKNVNSYHAETRRDFKGVLGDNSGVINQYIYGQNSELEIQQRELTTGSPYLGLRKFGEKDKDKFFGREQWIVKLTNHLSNNQVLFLLGASGSGKSSLIQAGLLPALDNQLGANQLRVFTFVPYKNPFKSFFNCLAMNEDTRLDGEIAEVEEEDTLTKIARRLGKDSQWLLFIDQFEELFTLTGKTERDIFIKSLLKLINTADGSVKVVLTMRADFLDKLGSYPGLVEVYNRCQRLLGDMDDTELRLAIAEPAARNGVIFEKGLIEQIIEDFHQQAGSLPLLQYTLDELWRRSNIQERVLKVKAYQDIGGVTGALQQQADRIYQQFDQQQQELVKQIFFELIELDDKKAVSRRAKKSSLEQNEMQKEVLSKLINNRLLVSNEEGGKATVEVAHEALLDSWEILKELTREKEEIFILRSRLYADAKQWDRIRQQDEGKANSELWSGSKLARIVEFTKEQALPNLDGVAIEFIKASLAESERVEKEREKQRQRDLKVAQKLAEAREKALQESQKREVEQKKANKKLLQGSIFLGFLFVVASGLGWMAWQKTQQAELNLAHSRGFSSLSLFDKHKELEAFVEAIKAGKTLQNQHEYDTEVMDALQELLNRKSEHNRLVLPYNSYEVVTSVSFSSDGKILATAIRKDMFSNSDRTIKLWNIETGKEIRTLSSGHNSDVNSVSFSPDGKTLASGNDENDKTIKLWNVETGQEIRTLSGHNDYVTSVSFSSDGKTLASGSGDNTIKLWNVETGKEIRTLTGHNEGVTSVSFSSDGKTLASDSFDRTIKLWNVETGKEIRTLSGHNRSVLSVSFSSDGKTLASGSFDRTIKLWNVETGKEIRTLTGHNEGVTSVSFSSDGKTLASGSRDKTIKLWNVETGKEVRTLSRYDSSVDSVSFSRDGKTLVAYSIDDTIKLWNVETGKEIRTLTGHNRTVLSVSFSSDGKTLASASSRSGGTIELWNVETRKVIRTLTRNSGGFLSVSFSSDGKTLASGSRDKTIKLWNVETGKEIRTLTGYNGDVTSVSFSGDGKILASSCQSYLNDCKTIELWNVETGKEIRTLTGHESNVNSISFSSDGKTLASGSQDKTIKLWNVETGQEIRTLTGHRSNVNSVSFSSDGKTLASGSQDKTIKLWNVETGKEIRTLSGHNRSVLSVSFSSDGKTLASGSYDKTIKLWNVETGQEIRTLSGHTEHVSSVSFSPNGKTLASGSDDGTIKLWNGSNGWGLDALMKRSCDWIRSYLHNPNSDVREEDRHLCDGIGTKQ